MSEKEIRTIRQGLPHVQFWINDLLVRCVDAKLSGHAMRLLIYYMSNCNHLTRKSHRITHRLVMEDLGMSRRTLQRAYNALEDEGLLIPPPESTAQVYDVLAIPEKPVAEEKDKTNPPSETPPKQPSKPKQEQQKPPLAPGNVTERTAERTERYIEKVGKKPHIGHRDTILRADDRSFKAWLATLKPFDQ